MDFEERKQALVQKTFRVMFKILLIFGIPAFGAYFLGEWIDTKYDIRPTGSLLSIVGAAIISWTMVIIMYRKLNKEFAAIKKEEEMVNKSKKEVSEA